MRVGGLRIQGKKDRVEGAGEKFEEQQKENRESGKFAKAKQNAVESWFSTVKRTIPQTRSSHL
jgi:hypothetical protein